MHELCHALVQGPTLRRTPDWGLDNTSNRDAVREAAAVRLQAHLLGAYGLREVLFPTTVVRDFFEALPNDALLPAEDESARLAKVAAVEAARPPFRAVLLGALEKTARAINVARHPKTGFALSPNGAFAGSPQSAVAIRTGHTCGECVWRSPGGLCRQSLGRVRVAEPEPACARFEGALDCRDCGACCTSGFDAVPVARGEKIARRHPSLIVESSGFRMLARAQDADDGRCVALAGPTGGPFSCMLYGDRPRACRELELGGRHCLTARRRVGLTVGIEA